VAEHRLQSPAVPQALSAHAALALFEDHAAVTERLRSENSNRQLELALPLALAESLRRSEE